MTRGRWLVPDTIPTDTICRTIEIPNELEIIAAVNGALSELIYPQNWEATGQATPAEMADAMADMFFGYAASECATPGAQVTITIAKHQVPDATDGGGISANTNTRVPWNTFTVNECGIALLNNIFTIPPGDYLVQGWHVLGLNTSAFIRMWGNDETDPDLHRIEGGLLRPGTTDWEAIPLVGKIVTGVEIDYGFWARSNVGRATDAFGLGQAVTGVNSVYGEMLFLRLGDVS